MLAGVIIYESAAVAHAQYIASSERAELGALDRLFLYLLNEVFAAKPISTSASPTRTKEKSSTSGSSSKRKASARVPSCTTFTAWTSSRRAMRKTTVTPNNLAHLPRQMARFGGVGALDTALTFVLYQVLLLLLPYWLAYTLSFAAGIAFAVLVNARFVFEIGLGPRSAVRFVLFGILRATSWVLPC